MSAAIDALVSLSAAQACAIVRAQGYADLLSFRAIDFVLAAAQTDFWRLDVAPCDHVEGRRYALLPQVPGTTAEGTGDRVDARYAVEVICTQRLDFPRLSELPEEHAHRLMGGHGCSAIGADPASLAHHLIERDGLGGICNPDLLLDRPVVVSRFVVPGIHLAALFAQAMNPKAPEQRTEDALRLATGPDLASRSRRSLGFSV